MPAPLSLELRKKIIAAREDGWAGPHVAKMFGVEVNTIYRLEKLKRKEGHVRPKEGYQKGHSKKVSLIRISALVRTYPDWTQKQIGQRCGLARTTVGTAMKKLGLTRKKKPFRAKSKILSQWHYTKNS